MRVGISKNALARERDVFSQRERPRTWTKSMRIQVLKLLNETKIVLCAFSVTEINVQKVLGALFWEQYILKRKNTSESLSSPKTFGSFKNFVSRISY